MWVSGGREPESISFDEESFGNCSECEIRYHVRVVTLRDVMFRGGI